MIIAALLGNPNSGKTTVFNRLTGSSQRVGNWPGVTIERKTGRLRDAEDISIVDLPGTYSLSPYSPEEVITRDYLIEERPDVVINIVDASNPERNLYLTTQILETGIPVVVLLNMTDIAESRGIGIDAEKLSAALGCAVIPACATKDEGLDGLADAVRAAVGGTPRPMRFSAAAETAIAAIAEDVVGDRGPSTRWYAVKLLERDPVVSAAYADDRSRLEPLIAAFEAAGGDSGDSLVAEERYGAIGALMAEVLTVTADDRGTVSDRIDRVLTNKWLGLPIFAGIMFVTYYIAMTSIGAQMTDWVNDVFFGEWVLPGARSGMIALDVDPLLIGLVVDGMLTGVGAVLGFLPQVLVLFVLLTILEDCGYMARICFIMDRVFRRFNLSGKSFIPLLVGTGCGVPGIMSSRTIENESDRKLTAMTVTFMPCAAKLPIIALIAGALFGGSAFIALFCYFLGIAAVLVSGIILKKWRTFAGTASIFIMELPPYHMPKPINVAKTTFDRGWAFVRKAGTFIMLACVAIWALSSFDIRLAPVDDIDASMLAVIGQAVTGIFVPLGWGGDWEFTVATITGLLAKENIVGTFGVLFGLDSEAGLWTAVGSSLGVLGGLSFLAFNMVCAPCFAAIGAIRRELGTWKATGFAVAYQCLLAYAIALMVYRLGELLLYGTFGVWTVMAAAAAVLMAYLLIAADPFRWVGRGVGREAAA